MTYLLLIIGFVLLVKGADWFVDGSASIARLLKVPSVIIGLTIVALGTSAPEAAVSITAGLAGNNDIALSNIVGSNVFNLLVVVGVCAIIQSFHADEDIIRRDYPFTIILTGLLWYFARDLVLSRVEGIILLILMIGYIAVMIYSSFQHRESNPENAEEIQTMSPLKSILLIIIGIAAIVYGGDVVVNNASIIAAEFGLSQTLIGLTIVAIGTSLPELATSVVAARKGESGLALGNAVGSSIFNILFILGASSVLSPISVATNSLTDIVLLLGITILTYLFVRSGSRVSKTQGFLSLLIYIGYMAYVIVR